MNQTDEDDQSLIGRSVQHLIQSINAKCCISSTNQSDNQNQSLQPCPVLSFNQSIDPSINEIVLIAYHFTQLGWRVGNGSKLGVELLLYKIDNQSINQSNNQSINQASRELTNESNDQSIDHSNDKSDNLISSQSVDQSSSIDPSISQPIKQQFKPRQHSTFAVKVLRSINQSNKQTLNHQNYSALCRITRTAKKRLIVCWLEPNDQSINQSNIQSNNQSNNLSNKPSNNQLSVFHSCVYAVNRFTVHTTEVTQL